MGTENSRQSVCSGVHARDSGSTFKRPPPSILAVFTGFEDSNRYKILDGKGEKIYFAAEGKLVHDVKTAILNVAFLAPQTADSATGNAAAPADLSR